MTLRSIISSPISGILTSVLGVAGSSPATRAAAIALAAGGALYDPSDLTSLYQSRTGGSTGATGQPVGIMLDKSYMGGQTAAAYIAAQTEKLSGSWTTSASGSSTATESPAGQLNLTGDGTNSANADISFTTVANRWYQVTATVATNASAFRVGTAQAGTQNYAATTQNAGPMTVLFLASATTTWFRFNRSAAGVSVITAISVKEIPGFHAIAPSDAARPIVTVAGVLTYLTADGVDDWMNVTPTLNLGEAWWHVGGWRSDTSGRRVFGVSSIIQGGARADTSNYNWFNSGGTAAAITGSVTPANAHVLTIEQASTTALAGRFNAANGASITPYDDSGATQGLALFSDRNGAWANGLAGRFYGGAFAPGALSAADRATLEAYMTQAIYGPYQFVNAEAAAYVAAMTVYPGATRAALIDTFIGALKTASVWADIDVLYLLAAHDSQAARLNLKNPGTYTATETSSPTFTADRGYAGNGTTSYLDSNFAPATNGVGFTQNSAHLMLVSRTSGQSGNASMGAAGGTGMNMSLRNASDQFTLRVSTGAPTTHANTDGAGRFIANRTGSTASEGFRNGSSLGTSASASAAPASGNLRIGATSAQFSTRELAAASAGAGLTAPKVAAFDAALAVYLTGVGA